MSAMHEGAAVIGWVVMTIGATGVLCVLAWLVLEQWWRLYHRARCVADLIEAVNEWKRKYPEKAKAHSVRVEKAR